MNELNKLYKAMLQSWGAVIKDDGQIVFRISGAPDDVPITIDGMPMFLPTSEVLEGNCIGKVFFHPACENILSKETEVFKVIRRMTMMRLLDAYRKFPIVLIGAAGKEKKAWNQATLDMMAPLKSVKRSVLEEMNELYTRIPVEIDDNGIDMRFIHFKVTKGGGRSQRTGERVYYKTKPVFPFYNELTKRLTRSEGEPDGHLVEFGGHSISRGALKLAAHLFKSLVPAVLDPEAIEYESYQSTGARLVSYLGCYCEIAGQMNRVQNLFRAEFDKAGIYPIDVDWFERLDELDDIYRQVPVLDYNSHNTQDETPDVATQQVQQNFAGLMAINSTPQQAVQGASQPNQQLQQMASNAGFDLTVPILNPGDRWQRTEIDTVNARVIHHAVTMNGTPVIYLCTARGNLLQRNEGNAMAAQMAAMMVPGMVNNMMVPGMMPNMMPGMMPNMMGYNGMMMARPVTAGGAAVNQQLAHGGYNGGDAYHTQTATY